MEEEQKCICPVCRGGCRRCMMGGCGMCPYCRNRGGVCPQCAAVLEGYSLSEMKDTVVGGITFDRVVMILILLLVIYLAYKHYQE